MAEISKPDCRAERKTLTVERLKELLHYDPDTGEFTRRCSVRGSRGGTKAGTLHAASGYIVIGIDSQLYKAHRLAWLYMMGSWPKDEIDHRNGDRSNNRWGNLREATRLQNGANCKLHQANTSGVKGVSWDAYNNRWRAYIVFKGRQKYLGRFDSLNAAAHARAVAARLFQGEFARS